MPASPARENRGQRSTLTSIGTYRTQNATVIASPPAIHSTPWRWPNRPETGAIR